MVMVEIKVVGTRGRRRRAGSCVSGGWVVSENTNESRMLVCVVVHCDWILRLQLVGEGRKGVISKDCYEAPVD